MIWVREMLINATNRLQNKPQAIAIVRGTTHSHIFGIVKFYQRVLGVLVEAEIRGLPDSSSFLGFHIHEAGRCTGEDKDAFSKVGAHYNPLDKAHPLHAGDLPPLLNNHGYAFGCFLSDRFTVKEVIGRGVIIHSMTDDFTSQPSGNAGEKIACGEIRSTS